jgi:hypothetical protein
MVVFLRAVGRPCARLRRWNMVLVVVVIGVLHIGIIISLATVSDSDMAVFPRADVVFAVVVSSVLHVIRVPCSKSYIRWWSCSWLCPSSW